MGRAANLYSTMYDDWVVSLVAMLPGLKVLAFTRVLVKSWTGPVYRRDVGSGSDPSVVYRISEPAVVVVIVNVSGLRWDTAKGEP